MEDCSLPPESQTSHFTPESRQETLGRIVSALEADERITGVLLVGSAAVGFDDDLSDIDLCVVTSDEDAETVFHDWGRHFAELLPVIHSTEITYGPGSYLHVILLDGFLELDAGFMAIGKLSAKRGRWHVAFDRSGRIEGIMQRTWTQRPATDLRTEYLRRADCIWHVIMHAGQAIQRGHSWRAISYIETIRTRTLELACLRRGLDARVCRQVHFLPSGSLDRLQAALPASTDNQELHRALAAAVDCFFPEAREWDSILETGLAELLETRMREYLALVRRTLE